jgi:hypothetical protein
MHEGLDTILKPTDAHKCMEVYYTHCILPALLDARLWII